MQSGNHRKNGIHSQKCTLVQNLTKLNAKKIKRCQYSNLLTANGGTSACLWPPPQIQTLTKNDSSDDRIHVCMRFLKNQYIQYWEA